MCQTGFGILVEGLRGGTVSPASNINFFFFHSQMEKDHLNIFFSEKNRGFLEKPAFMPKQANAIHPNPTPYPAALGRFRPR